MLSLKQTVRNMKKLRLWVFTFLLASTLFLAIEGHADSNRPSINANGMVRLVYFLPSDRPARPDRIAALRQVAKDAQQFYADEMERHGYGRKTFTIETDTDGEPFVHQINGKFREDYYYSEQLTDYSVLVELLEHFDGDDLQHVYFIAIDLSYEALCGGTCGGLGGVIFYPTYGDYGFGPPGKAKLRHRDITPGEELLGGFALIPAHGRNFERLGLTLHELGHGFGLVHDFREGLQIDDAAGLSQCAAEWLSVSRFFNTKSTFHNEPGEIQLLSLRAYSQDIVGIRFKVTDPDGLHQVQLLVPEILPNPEWAGWGPFQLFDCKRLNDTTDIVDFVVNTAELVDRIGLQIIDADGTVTYAIFPIQLDEIEPVQNAPDVNNDGVVNLSDLIPIASHYAKRGQDEADVNSDGVVDIVDVLLVAAFISSLPRQTVEMFGSAAVQQWLTDARALDAENKLMATGIVVLEYLLAEIERPPIVIANGGSNGSQLKAIFEGHTDYVWSVAFSPDGQTLASGSWDKTIRLWDTTTWTVETTLTGHTDSVWSVAFSPDGQTLASGSWDKTIRLWDTTTWTVETTLTGHTDSVWSVAFSPDGQTLAGSSWDKTIRLWDTTTWTVETTLTGHTGSVDFVAFSPDGGTLASGSRDNTIRLWNPHIGNHIRRLTSADTVNRLAFSPDSQTLASAGWDNTIRLWNPNTGKLKRTLPNQGGWVNPVAFSPDGATLVIGNRGISLWDIETGQYKKPLAEDIGDAVSLVFNTDGTMLASGSGDGKVRLWDFTPFLITPGLSKISGDNQTGVSGTVLSNPFVIKVRDENLSVRKGISVTFTVTAGDGTLSVTRTATDEDGRAQSTLTLGQNPGTNAVSVSVAGIEGTVVFSAVVEAAVNIPDPNLRAVVETALKVAPGTPIVSLEMETLPHLEARNANISYLTGLEFATNLTELYLGAEWVEAERNWQTSNLVSNLSPLAGLTKLTRLDLRGNNISDLSPLAGLINLTYLELWDNHISDLSPLARLTNLTELRLGGNSVSNLSPLAGLTNLTTLLLQRNPISDLSPLVGLTNLTRLGAASNNISDLSPLAGLTNLTTLGLRRNRISDLSPLAGLTNLKKVVLISNSISDLSPLVANTGLGNGDEIYVNANPLSYQSIHTHIPTLQSRGVTVEFDNRAHSALLKISGDNQNGASLTSLSQSFVVEAQNANGSTIAGISVTFAVTAGSGTLSTTITRTDANGRARSTLTLGPNLGTNTVEVSATGIKAPVTFHAVSDTEAPPITADVNNDGSVNVLDLVVVASELGNTGSNLAVDVNRDGAVNVLDLILVAGMFDSAAAAPAAQPQVPETLTAVEVQGWLTDARALEVRDLIMKRGFVVLEQLLISLTPKETELLANYPNPFNPETWIPYRLAEDAFVTLTIYDIAGQVVRSLDVGHRIASVYESRSKAIYWDGRNEVGEGVASGVYFYTLTAGNFSATRRMLILK